MGSDSVPGSSIRLPVEFAVSLPVTTAPSLVFRKLFSLKVIDRPEQTAWLVRSLTSRAEVGSVPLKAKCITLSLSLSFSPLLTTSMSNLISRGNIEVIEKAGADPVQFPLSGRIVEIIGMLGQYLDKFCEWHV